MAIKMTVGSGFRLVWGNFAPVQEGKRGARKMTEKFLTFPGDTAEDLARAIEYVTKKLGFMHAPILEQVEEKDGEPILWAGQKRMPGLSKLLEAYILPGEHANFYDDESEKENVGSHLPPAPEATEIPAPNAENAPPANENQPAAA